MAGRAGARAGAKLQEVVHKSPASVKFLTALGTMQLASGDANAAQATFRRAVEENPRREESHLQLADAWASEGRREEARQEYELTLKLNPRSAAAWWGLANLAEKAGDRAALRDVLTRALAAGTESPALQKRLAELEAARPTAGGAR